MKITFDISSLVPKYLMADRNGRALAKAIERAFEYVSRKTEQGIDILQDVDKMPEWRLDERAWELDCLYEYTADIEQKREWIKNATYYYTIYGTPKIIREYISAVFDGVDVEEWFSYDEGRGNPYHFRVSLKGTYNIMNDEWVRKTIQRTKNVRSYLDDVRVKNELKETVHVGTAATEHIDTRLQNDVTRENEGYIGVSIGAAALSEVIGEDVITGGQDAENDLTKTYSAGTITTVHHEITLITQEVA